MKRRGFLAAVAALTLARSCKKKPEEMLTYPTPYTGLDPADMGGDTTVWWRAVMVKPNWDFVAYAYAHEQTMRVTAIPAHLLAPDQSGVPEGWTRMLGYRPGDVMCYESTFLRTGEKQDAVYKGSVRQSGRPSEQDRAPARMRTDGAGSIARGDQVPHQRVQGPAHEGEVEGRTEGGRQVGPPCGCDGDEPRLRQARPGSEAQRSGDA